MAQRKRFLGVTFDLYGVNVNVDPATRTAWDIPNRDGRFNYIRTNGTCDTRDEAIAEAHKWIQEYHDRRAARYGIAR